MPTKTSKWIVLPDMQVPYEDKDTLKAVEAYMGDHRWDGYINLGDFLDFNEISSYVQGKPGAIEEKVDETFTAGNKILDRHCKLTRAKNPKARMVILEGNHDYRAESYRQLHPELGQSLNVARGLHLRDRGIEWIPSWSKGELFKIGHAYFTHGKFTSKYHSERMANAYGKCIYYGHTHDVQEFPKVLLGDDSTIEAASLGCLCRYDQKYLKGSPTNWQQSFSVFHFFEDGFYNRYTCRIFKHRFVSPEGKVYGG